jgi:RNA ligase (TIGR02306 family)
MSERKLATIRRIDSISLIEGADTICLYHLGGWQVVDTIGKYKQSDLVIYLETDSWVPAEIAPFLSKGKEPSEFNGIKGERLRTIKLRGQLSQGLLLPVAECFGNTAVLFTSDSEPYKEGDEVSDALSIQKYEKPIPAQLTGLIKGNFPSFVPKTDQERIQNLSKQLSGWTEGGDAFEVTEKLEGSSMTVYLHHEQGFGVCSRNLDLKEDQNNAFWGMALKLNLKERLTDYYQQTGVAIALQGELIGPGIQGNIYGLSEKSYYVYDVFVIHDSISVLENGYQKPEVARVITETLGLTYVPVIDTQFSLKNMDMQQLISQADGFSKLNPKTRREGLVFKHIEKQDSFKAISNAYLLKQKD